MANRWSIYSMIDPHGIRAAAISIITCFAVAAAHAEPPPASVLRLINDGYAPGRLRASTDPKVLRWQCPLFAQPLEFPLAAVRAVHYSLPPTQPRPVGEYCFELAGDDVLYGNLLSLTADEVEVESTRIGRVHLRREQIGRFYPCKGGDFLYQGPDGLTGWRDPSATAQWRDDGGQLVTDKPGATLVGDLGIPAKAIIEFELSWKHVPDFVFAVGVNDQETTVQQAFRFEVWEKDLVVVGESGQDADVVAIQEVGPGEGHIRLQAYLDQENGRMLVLSRSGKLLATLNVSARKHQVLPAVRLHNHKGDLRLEHLRITRWNDVRPSPVSKDQSRVQRSDGSVVYGQLAAYDPKSKQFSVRDGKTETVIKQDAIADVYFSASVNVPAGAGDAASGKVRVVYHDGSRYSGKLTRIEDTHLSLICPGIKELLRLPLADARSLVALWDETNPGTAAAEGRGGRLEMDGLQLRGLLQAGSEQSGASCLVWRPDLALNASPLLPGASGRIVYRDAPPAVPKQNVQPGQRVIQRVRVVNGAVVRTATAEPARKPGKPNGSRAMHLRSGDTIPCEVVRIDEKGVTFKTPLSEATFVPNEKIKSVELIASDPPKLGKTKRERLLTLPRMQKDSPPTHLICSTNGDFLRGRIVEMDEKTLKLEVRLETREIPRDRIAQIIWLHADELTGPKATPAPATPSQVTRTQTLKRPDNRLTFVAQKMEKGTLQGMSDVLGPVKADLADVDELLFGASIEESASKLTYQRWKLHNAVEPKFAQEGATPERLTGTESPLVGQPAFAFKLDLLDGKQYHLANRKGRLVVLDFWATWCGPCMQTMPLIDGVVREFAGQNVELVAVNLEEQPEQIKSMLERHKLKIDVALDRDGVVAAKYGVTAIPQTVLVDRAGKVARLFVGGGQGTADSLRKALQELTSEKAAQTSTP